MARRQRRHGGGIASLRALITQHSEAVEYDLIRMGLRLEWLGTKRLTWRDLLVIVHQAQPGSRIAAVLAPALAWTTQEHLLAGVFDVLRLLAWLQTKDAKTGRNRPTPIARPGVQESGKTRIGSGSKSIADMEAWLAKRNPAQHRKG